MNARRKETKGGGHTNHHVEGLTSLEARVTRLERLYAYIYCVRLACEIIVHFLS